MPINLRALLEEMIEKDASDLHLVAGERPKLRVDGDIVSASSEEVMTPKDTLSLAYSVLTENQKKRFETESELDFSFGIQNLARFRGNCFKQRGCVSLVIRQIPYSVKTFDELLTYLARATEVGQTVALTVLRQDKEDTLQVTLNARTRPETPRSRAERGAVGGIWLGITGQTVTPKVAQAMRLPATQRGVLVDKVERGSPADQAGLRGTDKTIVVEGLRVPVGGDIIVAFDDKPVTQVQDLQTLIRHAQPGQTVKLTIVRQGKRMQLQVTLMERSAIRP